MFGVAGGSIVNLTALDGIPTAPASLPDPGADAAIDAMTRGLSRAYGTRNVRVSTIAPGMLGPEEPAAIDVLDGSVRNRQFIALLAARNHTTEGIADIAVALTCDDSAASFRPRHHGGRRHAVMREPAFQVPPDVMWRACAARPHFFLRTRRPKRLDFFHILLTARHKTAKRNC